MVNDLAKKFGAVEGAGDVRSALSKARRALRGRSPDQAKAMEAYEAALEEFRTQLAWRTASAPALVPELNAYLAAISETLGARQQPKLTRDQALFLAGCNAVHRDISLNF